MESAASAARDDSTPGRADGARPGVWLTDLSLVGVAVIWGVNFSVVKYGTTLVSPLAYNGARIAIAAVVLVVAMLLVRAPAPARRDVIALLILGVLGNAIYQYLFVQGVARTRASDAALVIAATPAFTAIIGRLRGTERTGWRGIIGIALSIAGIAFVVGSSAGGESGGAERAGGQSTMTGDLLVLLGSLCWAVYTVLLKPYTLRLSGVVVSAYTMVGGALALLLVALGSMAATPWRTLPGGAWAAIVYSSIGSLVVAYYFWYRGIRLIGPTRTSMYSNLQPVVAVLVAWAMLGETPGVPQGAGAACIIGGLLLSRS